MTDSKIILYGVRAALLLISATLMLNWIQAIRLSSEAVLALVIVDVLIIFTLLPRSPRSREINLDREHG